METMDGLTREGMERPCPTLTIPNPPTFRRRPEIFDEWIARIGRHKFSGA